MVNRGPSAGALCGETARFESICQLRSSNLAFAIRAYPPISARGGKLTVRSTVNSGPSGGSLSTERTLYGETARFESVSCELRTSNLALRLRFGPTHPSARAGVNSRALMGHGVVDRGPSAGSLNGETELKILCR